MVGPGEVDNDLEGEVIEECAKYGETVRCLIYAVGLAIYIPGGERGGDCLSRTLRSQVAPAMTKL